MDQPPSTDKPSAVHRAARTALILVRLLCALCFTMGGVSCMSGELSSAPSFLAYKELRRLRLAAENAPSDLLAQAQLQIIEQHRSLYAQQMQFIPIAFAIIGLVLTITGFVAMAVGKRLKLILRDGGITNAPERRTP